MLIGDQRRTCTAEGRWNLPEFGYTECLREYSAKWVVNAVFVCGLKDVKDKAENVELVVLGWTAGWMDLVWCGIQHYRDLWSLSCDISSSR